MATFSLPVHYSPERTFENLAEKVDLPVGKKESLFREAPSSRDIVS